MDCWLKAAGLFTFDRHTLELTPSSLLLTFFFCIKLLMSIYKGSHWFIVIFVYLYGTLQKTEHRTGPYSKEITLCLVAATVLPESREREGKRSSNHCCCQRAAGRQDRASFCWGQVNVGRVIIGGKGHEPRSRNSTSLEYWLPNKE